MEAHPVTKAPSNTHEWLTSDFSTSGRVQSSQVSPEVWLSTIGRTCDPSLAWKKVTFSKIKDDDDEVWQ